MARFLKKISFLAQWQKNLFVLWFGVLLACASYTMIIPFLPMYLINELGVETERVNFWSGLIFSIAFLGGAVMAPYWGAQADKKGKMSMIIRAGFSLAFVYALAAVVRNEYELLIVRAAQGIVSGFVPASMSLVANSLPRDKTGWGLGLMQTAISTGSILGPLFGGLLVNYFTMRWSFVIAGMNIFLATLAVKFFVREERQILNQGHESFKKDFTIAYENKPLLHTLLLFSVVQGCIMMLQPLLTLYIGKLQGSMQGAMVASGIIFSLIGVAGIVAAPYWGGLGQKKGFGKTLFLVLFGAGIAVGLQTIINNLWLFGLGQFIFGLFLAGTSPTMNANLVNFSEVDFRGRAFGLATSFHQLGSMLGPIIGGTLGSWIPTNYIFLVTSAILLVASFTVRKRVEFREK